MSSGLAKNPTIARRYVLEVGEVLHTPEAAPRRVEELLEAGHPAGAEFGDPEPQTGVPRDDAVEFSVVERQVLRIGGLELDCQAFGELLESLQAEAEAVHTQGDDGQTGREAKGYPDTDLGFQLQIAAGLLSSESGIRVVHVELGGFDTHDGQMYAHDDLMGNLGPSMAAFQDDLAARGLADKTLTITTSEFGRRPEENQSGTDHGTAGPALLCGPVSPGLFGDAPSIDRLDDDGNLVATTMLDDYYATIAEGWLGIDAGLVLPNGGTVITELFA